MKVLAIRPLADRALTVDLAERAGPDATARIGAACARIAGAMADGTLPGVEEVAASFASLTVHYDCLAISQTDLCRRLMALLADLPDEAAQASGRLWHLPCCYNPDRGIDLAALAERLAIPAADIISRHAATGFQVHALGFLPGLPFLGDLPEALALPRRASPRTLVPAGSVAIANRMCVIYPWDSPGGWHIVGRCPVPLFDPGRGDRPALLAVGDRVRFRPVAEAEADAIAQNLAEGRARPEDFLAEGH